MTNQDTKGDSKNFPPKKKVEKNEFKQKEVKKKENLKKSIGDQEKVMEIKKREKDVKRKRI